MPDELLLLLEKVEKEATTTTPSTATATSTNGCVFMPFGSNPPLTYIPLQSRTSDHSTRVHTRQRPGAPKRCNRPPRVRACYCHHKHPNNGPLILNTYTCAYAYAPPSS